MIAFALLGSVQATAGDESLAVGRPRQRHVLTRLVLSRGRLVSVDDLVEELWPEGPPPSAVANIRTYVANLRRLFTAAVPEHGLCRRPGGFCLSVGGDDVDLDRFEEGVEGGCAALATGDAPAAIEELRKALALWRGRVAEDVPQTVFVASHATALTQRKAVAIEHLAMAYAVTGDYEQPVRVLRDLVAAEPLRERSFQLQMLCQYANGDTAGALTTFDTIRRTLGAELGIDPGADLQSAFQAILRNEKPSDLLRAHLCPIAPIAVSATPVPAQLPAVAGLIPRQRPASQLLAACRGVARAEAPRIAVVTGMGGIGKTSLALSVAHQIKDSFPDGQLYVDLNGFGVGRPVKPLEGLRSMLTALGISGVPTQLDAAASMFRTAVAGRRMLLVLDNAADAAQVRPLLPGSAGHAVLVSSRDTLRGLAVSHGARIVTLDPMSDAESRRVLATRAGAALDALDPGAVDALIRACAGLPLALSLVAAHLASGGSSAEATLAELRHDGFDALCGADEQTDLRTVFFWSYRRLDPDAARLLRVVACAPGPHIEVAAVASVLGADAATVRPALHALRDAHLVTMSGDRLRCHDLIRAYAIEISRTLPACDDAAGALLRLVAYYLGMLERVDAGTWVNTWVDALVAAVPAAADAGLARRAHRLAIALCGHLQRLGRYADQESTQLVALRAAESLDDPAACAEAHRGAARAYAYLDRRADATAHLAAAQMLFEAADDVCGQARTRQNMAWLAGTAGDNDAALGHAETAVDLFKRLGDEVAEGVARNAAGWYLAQLGRYPEAESQCVEALAMLRRYGDVLGEASTQDSLGYIRHRLGDHSAAVRAYEESVRLSRSRDDRPALARSLRRLGETQLAAGQSALTRRVWREAYTILESISQPEAADIARKLAELDTTVPART
ncbi:MAG TPA: BTAD domain-containing putative transcriptional regulator [Micromonosporaceae bacterium]